MAYIRRSTRSRTDPGDISREFQIETVRALAVGEPELAILDGDWGKSAATDETDKRLAFLGLLAAVERGEVSTLYAYSTDRLARSVQWAARLLDACEKAGTTIVTGEGRFSPHDDMARQMFQFQAITNEAYSRQAKRKRASTIARQRARGDKLGQPYYGSLAGEDLPAVLAAFHQAGTYNGAAKILNATGVKSRRGHWAHSSVQGIVTRAEGTQPTATRGAKPRADHIFHRLLRCHCGHTLTGSHRSGGATLYRCARAETDFDHGRKSVTEAAIIGWAMEEVERLQAPDAVTLVDAETEAAELRARIERLRVAFVAGLLDEAAMLVEKAELDTALMRLDLAGRAVRVPAFSWDHPPRDLNLALRALWDHVELDETLRPIRAAWLVPEHWLAPRAPGSPAAQDR